MTKVRAKRLTIAGGKDVPSNQVDLVSAQCVNQHIWDWPNAQLSTETMGAFRGLPAIDVACLKCRSTKRFRRSWNGRMVGSPVYHLDDDYITNARKLADDMHERRNEYWRITIERELAGELPEPRPGKRGVA